MADFLFRSDDEIVTEFLLNTCPVREWLNVNGLLALGHSPILTMMMHGSTVDDEPVTIPLITGSTAELYIEPMLLCVDDVDIMGHRNNQLAVPAGTALPLSLIHI